MKKLLLLSLLLFHFTSFSMALASPKTAPASNAAPPAPIKYTVYQDQANGYSLSYPDTMTVDDHESALRTIISDQTTKIEIYRDDFTGTVTNSDVYITYGNSFTKNTKDHVIQEETNQTIHRLPVHGLKWMRAKLIHADDDKNYYASYEIVKNKNEVYTLFFKSSEPITIDKEVVQSFKVTARSGAANLIRPAVAITPNWNDETKALYQHYFAATAPLRWGIFEKTSPKNFTYLKSLEQKLDYQFPVVTRYQSLTGQYFPMEDLKNAYANGRLVELTMQTFLWGAKDEVNRSIMYDVLDGRYDAYLNSYAKKLKEFGHPVLFRLNNEMNGDWCWYSAFNTSKDTDIYTGVWRYIYQIFQANGVNNVLWVWNPHSPSKPTFAWNHYMMYYPGDEYVDIIGLTGYNNGTYYPGETWRSFDQIYGNLYKEYADLFVQPFMIAEFGSNSVGGDKAAWVRDMFASLPRYDRIKLAVWWSSTDYDAKGQPARIYNLDENAAVIEAFREGLTKGASLQDGSNPVK